MRRDLFHLTAAANTLGRTILFKSPSQSPWRAVGKNCPHRPVNPYYQNSKRLVYNTSYNIKITPDFLFVAQKKYVLVSCVKFFVPGGTSAEVTSARTSFNLKRALP